jgi:hypothetical protein
VGLKSLKSLNLTNGYPNKNKKNNNNNNNNNKVKSKPLELFELAGKNICINKHKFRFSEPKNYDTFKKGLAASGNLDFE